MKRAQGVGDPLHAKLRHLDMTQLFIFGELMRHRSVTVVARNLGRSQPAISHALNHLRDIFEDPLFLRRPGSGGRRAGLQPTARAERLEPMLAEILSLARHAFLPPAAFDPKEARATLRLAVSDYHCAVFAGPLANLLQSRAPNLTVTLEAMTHRPALVALSAGSINLALGSFPRVGERMSRLVLYEEAYVVVSRAGHPRASDRMTLDDFLSERHLVRAEPEGADSEIDEILRAAGRQRMVAATFPSGLSILAAAAESDFIATVPERLANAYACRYGLAVVMPPLQIRPFEVCGVWEDRDAGNPLLPWLLDLLVEIATQARPAAPRSLQTAQAFAELDRKFSSRRMQAKRAA